MAIDETFDTLDIAIEEIAIGDRAPIDDERPEPTLATTPFFVEFDEPARLDPKRLGLIWELPAATRREMPLRSPLVSLALHLTPLLAIIGWPTAVAEIPPPIPVALVFEEPPPPPEPQPPPPQPETGRLASVDMGDIKPKEAGTTTGETPPAAGENQPNVPPPPPAQAATPAAPPLPPPKPAPPKQQQAAIRPPKPSGAPTAPRAETPREAPRASRFAGPTASRDDYLAYLVALTRQHIDLLPLSVVGDRRGETVISVVVYGNGTIGPLGVLRSSGYPDIDRRIEQMVAAVRKFPPLPQWYQGNAVQLELTLRFPEAIEKP